MVQARLAKDLVCLSPTKNIEGALHAIMHQQMPLKQIPALGHGLL